MKTNRECFAFHFPEKRFARDGNTRRFETYLSRMREAGGKGLVQTDGELMRAVKAGDAEAFAELTERYWQRAVDYAGSLLRDDALAQDAAQDCFARVYLLRDRYRETFSFQAYLYAMLRNRCIDLLRARSRRAALPAEAAQRMGEILTPEALYLQGEERLRLLGALDRLGDDERSLLTDFAYRQHTYRELAAARRTSVALVKARLHRIRKKLRKVMDDESPY